MKCEWHKLCLIGYQVQIECLHFFKFQTRFSRNVIFILRQKYLNKVKPRELDILRRVVSDWDYAMC